MAITTVPNQCRVHTQDGHQPETLGGAWTWVGLATPLDQSGCVTFYSRQAASCGAELVTLCLGPGQQQVLGPFSLENGVCWAGLLGGSALVWFTQKDKH